MVVTTVTGGSGSEHHWRNDRILFMLATIDPLTFFSVSEVDGMDSMFMLVTVVFVLEWPGKAKIPPTHKIHH